MLVKDVIERMGMHDEVFITDLKSDGDFLKVATLATHPDLGDILHRTVYSISAQSNTVVITVY